MFAGLVSFIFKQVVSVISFLMSNLQLIIFKTLVFKPDSFVGTFSVLPNLYRNLQTMALALIAVLFVYNMIKIIIAPLSEVNESPVSVIANTILAIVMVFAGNHLLVALINLTQEGLDVLFSTEKVSLTDILDGADVANAIMGAVLGNSFLGQVKAATSEIITLILFILVQVSLFKVLKRAVEHWVKMMLMIYSSPLPWATLASSSTRPIFSKWFTMYIGECFSFLLCAWSFRLVQGIFDFSGVGAGVNLLAPLVWGIMVSKVCTSLDDWLKNLGIGTVSLPSGPGIMGAVGGLSRGFNNLLRGARSAQSVWDANTGVRPFDGAIADARGLKQNADNPIQRGADGKWGINKDAADKIKAQGMANKAALGDKVKTPEQHAKDAASKFLNDMGLKQTKGNNGVPTISGDPKDRAKALAEFDGFKQAMTDALGKDGAQEADRIKAGLMNGLRNGEIKPDDVMEALKANGGSIEDPDLMQAMAEAMDNKDQVEEAGKKLAEEGKAIGGKEALDTAGKVKDALDKNGGDINNINGVNKANAEQSAQQLQSSGDLEKAADAQSRLNPDVAAATSGVNREDAEKILDGESAASVADGTLGETVASLEDQVENAKDSAEQLGQAVDNLGGSPEKAEEFLQKGGVDAAKELLASGTGPTASAVQAAQKQMDAARSAAKAVDYGADAKTVQAIKNGELTGSALESKMAELKSNYDAGRSSAANLQENIDRSNAPQVLHEAANKVCENSGITTANANALVYGQKSGDQVASDTKGEMAANYAQRLGEIESGSAALMNQLTEQGGDRDKIAAAIEAPAGKSIDDFKNALMEAGVNLQGDQLEQAASDLHEVNGQRIGLAEDMCELAGATEANADAVLNGEMSVDDIMNTPEVNSHFENMARNLNNVADETSAARQEIARNANSMEKILGTSKEDSFSVANGDMTVDQAVRNANGNIVEDAANDVGANFMLDAQSVGAISSGGSVADAVSGTMERRAAGGDAALEAAAVALNDRRDAVLAQREEAVQSVAQTMGGGSPITPEIHSAAETAINAQRESSVQSIAQAISGGGTVTPEIRSAAEAAVGAPREDAIQSVAQAMSGGGVVTPEIQAAAETAVDTQRAEAAQSIAQTMSGGGPITPEIQAAAEAAVDVPRAEAVLSVAQTMSGGGSVTPEIRAAAESAVENPSTIRDAVYSNGATGEYVSRLNDLEASVNNDRQIVNDFTQKASSISGVTSESVQESLESNSIDPIRQSATSMYTQTFTPEQVRTYQQVNEARQRGSESGFSKQQVESILRGDDIDYDDYDEVQIMRQARARAKNGSSQYDINSSQYTIVPESISGNGGARYSRFDKKSGKRTDFQKGPKRPKSGKS